MSANADARHAYWSSDGSSLYLTSPLDSESPTVRSTSTPSTDTTNSRRHPLTDFYEEPYAHSHSHSYAEYPPRNPFPSSSFPAHSWSGSVSFPRPTTQSSRNSFVSIVDDPFFQRLENPSLVTDAHPEAGSWAVEESSCFSTGARGDSDDSRAQQHWPPPRRESLTIGHSQYLVCMYAAAPGSSPTPFNWTVPILKKK